MTFAPAILVAFVLNWALVARAGWPERRALGASVVFGIVLALVLQRVIARRGRE
jgi:predicted exporter